MGDTTAPHQAAEADHRMASPLLRHREGGVLTLTLSAPPVNALHPGLRRALVQALGEAANDPDLSAVILRGQGGTFSVGLDLAELSGGLPGAPDPRTLCTLVEEMPVPVIALIEGTALGAGLDLALACHHRVALATARMGFPEAGFGLVPSGGGTLRLSCLAGAEQALRLLLSARPVPAAEALAIGLLDRVVEEGGEAAARALAAAVAGTPPRRSSFRQEGLRDGIGYQRAVAAARARVAAGRLDAPRRIVDCVEAAQLLPVDQAMEFEAAAQADCAGAPAAAALIHATLAERRALLPPGAISRAAAPDLPLIGIWGEAGADLARQALASGARVHLGDASKTGLVRALEAIAARMQEDVAAGRMTEQSRDADWARLKPMTDPAPMAGAALVLAVPGQGDLPAVLGDAVLLGGLPATSSAPAGLVPATGPGGLAELALPPGTPRPAAVAAHALARKLGWKVVFTGAGGPADRRLRQALSGAIAFLEAGGRSRAEVAAALATFGLGLGPEVRAPAPPPGAETIISRCLAAMANEGARLVDDGILPRPADVDAVSTLSGLFPRWEGGPMHWADRRGLLVLRADLRRWAEAGVAALYAPSPLFDRLIADGRRLSDLNRG